MNKSIAEIWIESEEKGPITGGKLETNDNSDVIVTFNDGSRAIASFFTYENIEFLRQKNKKTGECLNGKFLWSSDMIIIDRIRRPDIEKVIKHIMDEGSFDLIFNMIEED